MWNKRVFKVPQCASHWHKKGPALVSLNYNYHYAHPRYLLLNMQGQITSWCNPAEVTVLTESMFFQDLCLIISELRTEYFAGLTPSCYFIGKLWEVTPYTWSLAKRNSIRVVPCISLELLTYWHLESGQLFIQWVWYIKPSAYTNYAITLDTYLEDFIIYSSCLNISLLRFQFFLTFTASILSLHVINYYTRNICSIFG